MLIVLLPVASLLTGCGDTCSCKKISCPAFEDPVFTKWFPYTDGQQVIFRTSSGKKDTITINTASYSESHDAKQGCTHADPGCSASADIISAEAATPATIKYRVRYSSLTPFTSSETTKSIRINLYTFDLIASGIDDKGLVLQPSSIAQTQNVPALTLNGSTFSNLQIVSTDTTGVKQAGPYKVYFSGGAGLIAFETYPGGELWVKQ